MLLQSKSNCGCFSCVLVREWKLGQVAQVWLMVHYYGNRSYVQVSRMTSNYVTLGLLLILLQAIPSVSEACKCSRVAKYPDIAVTQIAHSADVVFLGKVAGGSVSKARSSGILIFDVLRQWKGPEKQLDQLEFTLNGTLCDIWYEEGEEVVIYGFGPDTDGTYTATTCSQYTGARNTSEETGILDVIGLGDSTGWSNDYFAYGCGGGIAATYPVSVIYRNGRITKSRVSVTKEIGQVPQVLETNKAFADELFATLTNLDLDEINGLREPAAYYCYFQAAIGRNYYHADWGGGTSEAPAAIKELGRRLISLTNNQAGK